jgi:hypothetical protein
MFLKEINMQGGIKDLLSGIRGYLIEKQTQALDPFLQDIGKQIESYPNLNDGAPVNQLGNRLPPLGSSLESKSILTDMPQFDYGKKQAEMRMTQRDIKSPEEQAYINKLLGTDTPLNTGVNAIPTDLMAGFQSSEFALPSNAIRDMATDNVGLADGRNFRFGSMAEAGAFRNYLDSIGQAYNPRQSFLRSLYGGIQGLR